MNSKFMGVFCIFNGEKGRLVSADMDVTRGIGRRNEQVS